MIAMMVRVRMVILKLIRVGMMILKMQLMIMKVVYDNNDDN